MFRLSSCIGKASVSLPNKLKSYNLHPQTLNSRAKSSYSRQARLSTDEVCIPRSSPTPAFKLWCKFLKAVKYVVFTTVGVTAVTGGFVAYAKSDPELRDWLTILIPTLDEIIAIATQENMSYNEFIDLTKEYFGFKAPAEKRTPCIDNM